MKISDLPGDYAFPAAYNYQGMLEITSGVFRSKEEAINHFKLRWIKSEDVIWPVERLDNGGIYIPAPEELE